MPIDLGDGALVTVAPPILPAIAVAAPGPETTTVLPVAGPAGPAGPAGDQSGALLFTREAAGTVSGHRVVRPNPDGSISYASNDDLGDLGAPLWLTTQAGTTVEVCAFGTVNEPTWDWDVGPIYLGTDGALVQTIPASPALFLAVVGYASGPNSVFIDPAPPIRLI